MTDRNFRRFKSSNVRFQCAIKDSEKDRGTFVGNLNLLFFLYKQNITRYHIPRVEHDFYPCN